MDAGLRRELEEKVRSGGRLSREDGLALYASDDLAWLGGLAHEARTRLHGDTVRFGLDRTLSLDPTRGLPGSAAPAPDADRPADPAGRPPSIEETVRLAEQAAADGATELRIEHALHPALPPDHCTRLLTALTTALPQVALRACTASEIHRVERTTGRPAADLLDALVDAGLTSLTCDDAGIFDPEAGMRTAAEAPWEDYARIHLLAHRRGLRTPCAMRHGHVEEPRHRVDHLLRLRTLQDETGGFLVFLPLPHRPDDPGAATACARRTPVTGAEILKTFAVARLLLDNVPHIEVRRAPHGPRTVQLALHHGADATDGPAPEDAVTHDDLLELIQDAGFRPVRRDARYQAVQVHPGPDPARRDTPQPMRV